MNKKLRKLVRHPGQFFADAFHKRFASMAPAARAPKVPASALRYSIVVSMSASTVRFEQFLKSIRQQQLNAQSVAEILFVDTGAPDAAARRAAAFARRFAGNSRYTKIAAPSSCSARAVGASMATRDWVTFVDANDAWDMRYLQAVNRYVDNLGKQPKPVAIVCNAYQIDDRNGNVVNNHPHRQIVQKGARQLAIAKLKGEILPTISAAFFHRPALLARVSEWQANLSDAFEQRSVLAQFIMSGDSAGAIAFVPDAIYHRRIQLPIADGLAEAAFDFQVAASDVRAATALVGRLRGHTLETWLQRQFIDHALTNWLKPLVNRDELLAGAQPADIDAFSAALHEFGKSLNVSVVEAYAASGPLEPVMAGFADLFCDTPRPPRLAHIQRADETKSLIELRYYCAAGDHVERFVAGSDLVPAYSKTTHHRFLGNVFCAERIVWLAAHESIRQLTVHIDGHAVPVAVSGRTEKEGVAPRSALQTIASAKPPVASRPADVRWLMWQARRPENQRRYKDAWIILDRSDKADDNGEHLYRYLLKERPDINAYFVIEGGKEFQRLERDGFRLLKFGSLAHKIALLHAKIVASSHAGSFAYAYLHPKRYGSLTSYKFVFLQHGVTLGDLSRHFNGKPIDLFISSSEHEHETFVADGSYDMTPKQVVLSGFPRHDSLLRRAAAPRARRTVLVAPTWRRYLVSPVVGRSSQREAVDGFFDSDYAQHWFGLLKSAEFAEMMQRHDYQVVFFLHPAMEPYRAQLKEMLKGVEFHDPGNGDFVSIQQLFAEADVMLTDYSSVAFEMALIDKTVLYYQFDAFDFLESGAHTTVKGYFEFERDGFGPVCYDTQALLPALDQALARGGAPEPEYLERMTRTFAHRDGRNCARTVDAIENLWQAELRDSNAQQNALGMARRATLAEDWLTADACWRAAALAGATPGESDRALLARTKRQLGQMDEAIALLEGCAPQSSLPADFVIEMAEIASATGDWKTALERWGTALAAAHDERTRTHCALMLAGAQRMSGESRAALQTLDDLVLDDNNFERYLIERARNLECAGEWHEAAMTWSEIAATAKEPIVSEALLTIAHCHRQAANAQAAHAALARLLKIVPGHAEARRLLGTLAADCGDHAAICKHWNPLAKDLAGPLTPDEITTLAKARRLVGNAPQAAALLAALDARGEATPQSRMECAEAFHAAQNWSALETACERLVTQRYYGDPQRVWYLAAVAAARMSRPETALERFDHVLSIDPHDIEARIERASILWHLGYAQMAVTEWLWICETHRDAMTDDLFRQMTAYLLRSRQFDLLQRALRSEAFWRQHIHVANSPDNVDQLLRYAALVSQPSQAASGEPIVVGQRDDLDPESVNDVGHSTDFGCPADMLAMHRTEQRYGIHARGR